mgnify:CR=1 FL=1
MQMLKAYRSLTAEQKEILKARRVETERPAEELVTLLRGLALYDSKADKLRTRFGCGAGIGFVLAFASIFLGAVLPFAFVLTLLLVGLHVGLLHLFGISREQGFRKDGGVVVTASLGISSLAALIIYPIIAGEFDPTSPYAAIPLTILPATVASLLGNLAEGSRNHGDVSFYRHAIFKP